MNHSLQPRRGVIQQLCIAGVRGRYRKGRQSIGLFEVVRLLAQIGDGVGHGVPSI
jgi:hypothetical protein